MKTPKISRNKMLLTGLLVGLMMNVFPGCILYGEGTIKGKVLDASGDAIEGATVTTNPETTSATTDSSGIFIINNVSMGSYVVTATKSGTESSEIFDVTFLETFGCASSVADIILKVNTTVSLSWEEKSANGFIARGYGSSVVYQAKLYTFMGMDDTPGGGYNATGRKVQVYDPIGNTWTNLTDYPRSEGRYNAPAAEVNGMVYLFGGINVWGNYSTATVDKYNIATNAWTKDVATLPYQLGEKSVVIPYNGKVYIMGSRSYGGTVNKTVYAFNPSDNSFTAVTTFQNFRTHAVAVLVGDKIYIAGGYDISYSTAMESYDISDDIWTTLSPMPAGLHAAMGGVYNGIIYVIGGSDASGVLREVYAYDIAGDSWEELQGTIWNARCSAFGDFIGNKYYLVGGYGGATGSDGYGIMIDKLEEGTFQ